jgi:uncharacterized membrane protein YfcA
MWSAGIILITFAAAIVNGAIGYGFSSITVPLALFLVSNRVLNPALVAIEVVLNAYVLWVNRSAIGTVAPRVATLVVGLVPGVIAGTLVLSRVSPAWVKLVTYVALLPVILLQASGVRRPIGAERAAGSLFGVGLGLLYSVTTISGPPLAIALNNQGLSPREFRAALGFVRFAESAMTAAAYLVAGLFIRDSLTLVPFMVPSVAIGVPIGAVLIRHLSPETFRRICMSFDAWVVAFGLSMLLRDLRLLPGAASFSVLAFVVAIDAWLLYRYFGSKPRGDGAAARVRGDKLPS